MNAEPEFNPGRCPLCGEPNRCAVAAGAAPEACWCMRETFARGALDALPAAARDRYCICRRCANQEGDHSIAG